MTSVNHILRSIDQAAAKIIDETPAILRRTQSVAVPAMVLLASSYATGADAGPLMHAACVVACAAASCAVTGPVCVATLAACVQSCAVLELFGP